MSQSITDIVAAAKREVPSISAEQARRLQGRADVLFVDVRDPDEVAKTGKIAGAINVSRGMLEFRADETTPYHDKAFSRDKTLILYCASGGRSALGGKALRDMGYEDVKNLGAFKDWADNGLPVDRA
ncbi:MAG: rhodanese-like domain-containing protein [Pseudolabrys sp.]|jgi:rhodanese-related sulfurtransferase